MDVFRELYRILDKIEFYEKNFDKEKAQKKLEEPEGRLPNGLNTAQDRARRLIIDSINDNNLWKLRNTPAAEDLNQEFYSIIQRFNTEISLIGDIRIKQKLQEIGILEYYINSSEYRLRLGEIDRMIREELVPIEEIKIKNKWQFWK